MRKLFFIISTLCATLCAGNTACEPITQACGPAVSACDPVEYAAPQASACDPINTNDGVVYGGTMAYTVTQPVVVREVATQAFVVREAAPISFERNICVQGRNRCIQRRVNRTVTRPLPAQTTLMLCK